MANKRKIYFRADAGPEIGYGHYIRSLALADMLKQDFDCTMFTQSPTEYQLNEAKDICPVVALPSDDSKFDNFLEYLQGDEIVVLDNYFFTTDYQRAIKAKGCKLVCIDDTHEIYYVADAIICQSPGVVASQYDAETYTKMYGSLEYSLLRKPFLTQHTQLEKDYRTAVVAMGGADANNLTRKYLDALLQNQHIDHIEVIIGDAYRWRLVEDKRVGYHRNVSANQLSELFAFAGVVILPASTMTREALACGANILSGYYVDNQKEDYEWYAANQYVIGLGDLVQSDSLEAIAAQEFTEQIFQFIRRDVNFTNIPERVVQIFKNMNVEPKKILILGGGQMQVPIIQCANRMGLYTIVADMDPNAPGFVEAKECLVISTMDMDALMTYVQHHPIDGILTTSDAPVNVVAAVGEKFHLPAMSVETARLCTNKYLQRECLKNHGIKTPLYRIVKNGECPKELMNNALFPLIVKPVDSSASRGVQKVENVAELKSAIQEADSNSRSHTVIIEEFIEGQEFSVESFSQNGETHIIAITQKQTIGEEYGCFVEDTHIEPAMISDDVKHLIEAEVLAATKALGSNNCPNHTEVKVNADGAFIIESACRLGGDYITSDLVPLSTGVNMMENLIRLSIGEPADLEIKYKKCSAVQFLNTENYHRCEDFIHTCHPAIRRYEIEPYSKKQIRSSLDRLGYIILQTDTLTEMKQILNTIK